METGTGRRSRRRSTRAVVGLVLAVVTASLGTSSVTVAVPSIGPALGVGTDRAQWVLTAYLVAVFVLVLPAGWAGDRWGRLRVVRLGTVVHLVGTVACVVAPSWGALVAARSAQGAGAAAMMVLAVALGRDLAAASGVGRTMGLLGSASAIGTAVGPSLGGLATQAAGWRAALAVGLPLGVLVLLLLRPVRSAPGGDPPRRARSRPATQLPAPAVLGGSAVVLLIGAVMMTTLVAGPYQLGALGLGSAATGLVMSLGPVGSMLSGVPAGRLVDRVGPVRSASLGLVLALAGATGLAVVPVAWGPAGYAGALLVLTPGYALVQAGCTTAVLLDAAAQDRGQLSAVLLLARNLGLVVGAWGAGVLLAGAGAGGAQVVFAVAAAAVGLALVVWWATSRVRGAAGAGLRGSRRP
ncbi:MFS transporter [Klenkia sp. LSe6-5]|uniref:MFS transporter n=1 Tax=Klenkia sesuvii TaxID=3103137 RepID=A0ABU8DVY5_9ACTN